MGLAARPCAIRSRASTSSMAKPPPPPPRVKAGRTTTGALRCRTKASPSSIDSTTALSGTGSPMPVTSERKPPRSSAARTAARGVPSTRTPYRSRIAGVIQGHGQVEPGLAAQGREQRIRPVLGDHPLQVSDAIRGR